MGRRRGALGASERLEMAGRRDIVRLAPGPARHRDQGTGDGVAAGTGDPADGFGYILVALRQLTGHRRENTAAAGVATAGRHTLGSGHPVTTISVVTSDPKTGTLTGDPGD